MKFFNRYILLFSLITVCITGLFYLSLAWLVNSAQYTWVAIAAIGYAAAMFLSGFFIGKKDPYDGYFGLNYHLTTYIICCAVAWMVQEVMHLGTGALSMTLCWGVGIIIHALYWIIKRKNSIKGFDKEELFE